MTKHTTTQPFAGKIVEINGEKKIRWQSSKWLKQQISKFTVGENITAYITTKKPKRSVAQNNFLWKYNELIRREIDDSYTEDEMHNLFKLYCMPVGHQPYSKMVLGKKVLIPKSTTGLTKDEFAILLLNIQEFTRIPIPDTSEWN